MRLSYQVTIVILILTLLGNNSCKKPASNSTEPEPTSENYDIKILWDPANPQIDDQVNFYINPQKIGEHIIYPNFQIDAKAINSHLFTFPKSGWYPVKLRASVNDTTIIIDTSIFISSKPIEARVSDGVRTGAVGDTMFFYGHRTEGATLSWSFGDGGTSTLDKPYHVYNTTGSYLVTLSATGIDDTAKTDTITVDIVNPPTNAGKMFGSRLWHIYTYYDGGSVTDTLPDATHELKQVNKVRVQLNGVVNFVYNKDLSSGNLLVYSGYSKYDMLHYDYVADTIWLKHANIEGNPSIGLKLKHTVMNTP